MTLLGKNESLSDGAMLLESTLTVQQVTHPENSLEAAQTLIYLAVLHLIQGNPAKAQIRLEKCLNIIRQVLPTSHPSHADCISLLAFTFFTNGRVAEAIKRNHEARKIRSSSLREVFSISGEPDRLRWMEKVNLFSIPAMLGNGPELAASVLAFKGLVLDSVVADKLAMESRDDPAVKPLLKRRSELRGDLRQSVLEGSMGELSKEDYERKMAEATDIDRQLAAKVAGYREALGALDIGLTEVQGAVPIDAALVEMVAYWPIPKARSKDDEAEYRYAASVIRHSGSPVFVDLGRSVDVEKELERISMAISPNSTGDLRTPCESLHRLLIEPIEKAMGLGKPKILIFSPDGQLSFVPFSALMNSDGKFLCERYEVRIVASGRDLARSTHGMSNSGDAVLVGFPDYTDQGTRHELQNATGMPSDLGLARGGIFPVQREGVAAAMQRMVWDPLPGTMEEVEALGRKLQTSGINCKKLLGTAATEQNLRKAIRRPRILHIATHGFSWEPEKIGASATAWDVPMLSAGLLSSNNPGPPPINPMLQVGLALTGGQTTLDAWANEQVPPAAFDGILLADEVAELDLYGTELVVLSACDTAQGEIRDGEGVLGLRRAFVTAGVRNLLMTLWPIGDKPTVEIMTEFYDRVLAGEDPGAALNQVQAEKLREWARTKGIDRAIRYAGPFVLTSFGLLND